MDIPFKRPELGDKSLIDRYFAIDQSRSCERSFANVYLWNRFYHAEYAVVEDTLVFRTEAQKPKFSYPAGEQEQVKKALAVLQQYCEEKRYEFKLYGVTEEQFANLEEWYPGRFQIKYNEDIADYVYDREKLATLGGKKLHSKRNHINRFKSEHDNWTYETINDSNLEECFQMGLQWRNENGCEDDEEKVAEICVTLNSLRLFKELGLTGGLLRLDGEVIAFTIGEKLCDDTFVVHIEKAFADIQGAYPMINQQFIIHETEGYQYINREEDTGDEGLRKAKHSYRPVFMVQKGNVTLRQRR